MLLVFDNVIAEMVFVVFRWLRVIKSVLVSNICVGLLRA